MHATPRLKGQSAGRSGRTATRGSDKKAHPLSVDPPSDMSMSCTRRAEFESAAFRRRPDENSAFVAFHTPPPTDQKSSITISTSNTTTAHTQMDLSFVGVQGHQQPRKNRLRDILGHFGLLAYYTQLDVSFQIHYVA